MQPTSNDIGIWLIVVSMLVNLAAGVAVIVSVFRSQRRQVRMEESFATVNQVREVADTLGGRITGVDNDVKAMRESIVRNGDLRRESIEGKVEAVRKELTASIGEVGDRFARVAVQVGGLERETALLNQSLMQVDAKLGRMIERQTRKEGA